MNDLLEEFEAEIIDIVNAATKAAFIAGYKRGYSTNDGPWDLKAYEAWVKDNE